MPRPLNADKNAQESGNCKDAKMHQKALNRTLDCKRNPGPDFREKDKRKEEGQKERKRKGKKNRRKRQETGRPEGNTIWPLNEIMVKPLTATHTFREGACQAVTKKTNCQADHFSTTAVTK